MRLTQPPVQWVPGILSRGKERPGRDADHSPPSSAEVKIKNCTSSPLWVQHGLEREHYIFLLQTN
jgi:hypothetical protein